MVAPLPLLLVSMLYACNRADTARAPLATAQVGGHTLQMVCDASPAPLLGCSATVVLELSDGGRSWVGESTKGRCSDVRAACDATTGELAIRDDGGSYRVAAAFHGPLSGWSTQHLVDPGSLWLQTEYATGEVVANDKVDAMPTLQDAIEQQLVITRDTNGTTDGPNALLALVVDPNVARDHIPVLTELARACRLNEPATRTLIQVSADAVPAVYAGALLPSCYGQAGALDAATPGVVQTQIVADLSARTGLPDADDIALGRVAVTLRLKEVATSLEARLLLAETPGALDTYNPHLIAWVQLADFVDQLEPEAAQPARMAALAWAPGPAYAGCDLPYGNPVAEYRGLPSEFALAVTASLRDNDTPATRDALFAIGADTSRSGASRQLSRLLLAEFRDPRADQLADVPLNSCQAQRLAWTPTSAEP